MSPDLTAAGLAVLAVLALGMISLSVALVRFAEKFGPLTKSIDALAHSVTTFRVVHGNHRDSIDRHAAATRELAESQRLAPVTELESFELEACCGTGCCQGPLPEAKDATDVPLVPPTPSVSADELAASARRQAARDRTMPESVTDSPEGH